MDTLKITSQDHRVPRNVIMRRRRHIAGVSLAVITVVCTSTLPRVVTKCRLTITLSRKRGRALGSISPATRRDESQVPSRSPYLPQQPPFCYPSAPSPSPCHITNSRELVGT
ncbi:hypothetical protein SCLCIDRAFT_240914 [Scleroderma citrinum Foug A]|uniref:Uncharacterized protein n=1 Tax=Scleroderma citrinum Foug A TaxID=1036808 RepID=A0A0C3DJK6_9AGAM|nr:hypothetical protein SCLCIDRAFT_240914 [Scleroderma citrinum Foug A]